MNTRLRCAIYTRKSSEEGLDQNFNSLHAQREACEAYVLSQAGEGWSAIRTLYDDGGYSGGSMDRPALKQLMVDIGAGKIDVVVVYKVDRLTRSLADFAKIVEQFDARGVSFVSVTQAFNTTSSMGRLTLNVLLSFAQFEREVTGERIRDKIAASKAKGLRMGGRPPLGYDVKELRLIVNPPEAHVVRQIFERYLVVGSVNALLAVLRAEGVRSKSWVKRNGAPTGGEEFSRSGLYYLLSNVVYRGINQHKEKLYPGSHPEIIDETLWDAVQAKLADTNSSKPEALKVGEARLLRGRLFDDRGNAMIPVHTCKGAQRYIYYASRPKVVGDGAPVGSLPRISASMIEEFVTDAVMAALSPGWMAHQRPSARVGAAIDRVVAGSDQVILRLDAAALRPEAHYVAGEDGVIQLSVPVMLRSRQGATLIEAAGALPKPAGKIDRALVRGVVLAKRWAQQLETGEVPSVKTLASSNGLCEHYTAQLLPLAYLAPDLVDDILHGRQPRALTLAMLTNGAIPLQWDLQRRLFRTLAAA
jgi:DNA invertase Pin-like site-specific DNA recombinase